MNWKPNAAGDLETIHNGNRYRAEQLYGHYWLYRKTLELSAYGELMGRFNKLEECEARVLLDAPSATNSE